LDYVIVKGKPEPVLVYELLGIKGEIGPEAEGLAKLAGRALALYCTQDWEAAAELFRQVLQLQPDDPHACPMIHPCEEYLARPPGAGWEGVHPMDQK
jgi:adenylate cyclase